MRPYSQYRPTGFDGSGSFLPEQQDWLVLPIGRNRDSGCLAKSNWDVILKDLGGEGDDLEIHRFGHWACGWFEIAIVRPGSAAAVKGEEWEEALKNYPVANDEHFSDMETKEADEVWRDCYRLKDRITYIRENRNQFEFSSLADMLSCVRGDYFAGYASELIA